MPEDLDRLKKWALATGTRIHVEGDHPCRMCGKDMPELAGEPADWLRDCAACIASLPEKRDLILNGLFDRGWPEPERLYTEGTAGYEFKWRGEDGSFLILSGYYGLKYDLLEGGGDCWVSHLLSTEDAVELIDRFRWVIGLPPYEPQPPILGYFIERDPQDDNLWPIPRDIARGG